MEQDAFELFLSKSYAQGAPRNMKQAIVDIADTAHTCQLWFESYRLPATAADVIAMTRLIMERQAALTAADNQ